MADPSQLAQKCFAWLQRCECFAIPVERQGRCDLEYGGTNDSLRDVKYEAGDVKLAETEGRVYRNVELEKLPCQYAYTFVVTDDYQVVYGRMDSRWEVGVKHMMLAQGRTVLAAGEMRKSRRKRIVFNLESGQFTRKLARVLSFTAYKRLEQSTLEFFQAQSPLPVRQTHLDLRPHWDPSWVTLKRLVSMSSFRINNKHVLCKVEEFLAAVSPPTSPIAATCS